MKPAAMARLRDQIIANELSAATRVSSSAVGAAEINNLARGARADLYGAGPLQALIESPGVTDVLVNSADEVWVDQGAGLTRVDVHLGGEARVRALAVRLAAAAGRRLDDAQPVCDARLADGVRLHAVLPPLSPNGTTLSLRVPSPRVLSLDDLRACSMITDRLFIFLKQLISARISFLISGATGTGKTTLLAAILGEIAADERVIIIEESQELAPDHPHVVHLQTRGANVEGVGHVGLSDLVRHALRMRPDRIVLGECRGAEIRELLTAFNTGHEGGGATLHANTLRDIPARIAALGALANMEQHAISAQAVSAIDVVLHLRRGKGGRMLSDVGILKSPQPGQLQVTPAWHVTNEGIEKKLAGADELEAVIETRRA